MSATTCVLAFSAYVLVGCLLLLWLSKRHPELQPDFPIIGDYFGLALLLAWPLILMTWVLFRGPQPPVAAPDERRPRAGGLHPAGVAASDLSPGGTVDVAGRRYPATAEGGPVRAGEPVEIIGRAGRVLRVRASIAAPDPEPTK